MICYREDIGHDFPKNTYLHECDADSSSSSNRLAKRDFKAAQSGKKKAKRSWMPSWGS